jgi:hypothetical protein
MVHEPGSRSAAVHRHLEGAQDELGTEVCSHRPAHDRSGAPAPEVEAGEQGVLRDHGVRRCLRRELAACGFHWVGLHKAGHVLAAHDGLDEFGETFRGYFPGAIHQIDHFHVSERAWWVSGGDRRLHDRLCRRAFSDPLGLARTLRRGSWKAIAPAAALELAGYLEGVAPDLHGVERLPQHLRQGRMHVVGTGVVEKHQDLLVGRRMKHRGMRWTRGGAEAQLALQARRFCDRWPTRWGVVDR